MDIQNNFNKLSGLNKSLIITLPSTIDWDEYEKELDNVKDNTNVLNFKVSNFPKDIKVGDKCYITHKGFIKGWMKMVGLSSKNFDCSTTGKQWEGKFIERSGAFHYLQNEIPYKGFQGYRYFDDKDIK